MKFATGPSSRQFTASIPIPFQCHLGMPRVRMNGLGLGLSGAHQICLPSPLPPSKFGTFDKLMQITVRRGRQVITHSAETALIVSGPIVMSFHRRLQTTTVTIVTSESTSLVSSFLIPRLGIMGEGYAVEIAILFTWWNSIYLHAAVTGW